MMSIFYFILVFLFLTYFTNFFSFLSSLLILEACSLIIFFFSVYMMFLGFSMKFLLFYFVFIVSESAIGLSILVMSMKSFGSGNFSSMGILKF